ncbi:MAG: DUF1624 domain-containing protein [Ignavibacteriae bacterium]|nr:DUF1624 domain-containing protein [Ignavibacteriota bacterium]
MRGNDNSSVVSREREGGGVVVSVEGARTGSRIDSIDIVRGIAMIVMALDHTRDYFAVSQADPLFVPTATFGYFMTRWITHFCAPVFVFLAGTGAYLFGTHGKTKSELAAFLFTRGVWMIILELTIVRFGWMFNFGASYLFGQVIWAIGWSMILLAGLIFLPHILIALFALSVIVLHNAFDTTSPNAFGSYAWLWKILHVRDEIRLGGGSVFEPQYPLIPWVGLCAIGYAFGRTFTIEAPRRRRAILLLGVGLTIGFIILRATNLYGDPQPWHEQDELMRTAFSFVNTQKYPPSLLFVMMTIGPSLIALALLERSAGLVAQRIMVFGRVPLFYYILHLFVIHGLALFIGVLQGFPATAFLHSYGGFPAGFGFSLPAVYAFWFLVILLLYPVCLWYAHVKARHKSVLLSYL